MREHTDEYWQNLLDKQKAETESFKNLVTYYAGKHGVPEAVQVALAQRDQIRKVAYDLMAFICLTTPESVHQHLKKAYDQAVSNE